VRIWLSAVAGLVAGTLTAVAGMRSIYRHHADYVDYRQWLAWSKAGGTPDYQTWSYVGGMVIVAIPLTVLGWWLQRWFFGPSWRSVRRKDIPRSRVRRYRQVLVVTVLALEVPVFWFLVPGIVGLGRSRGYEWSAAVGCLAAALLVGFLAGVLVLMLPVDIRARRRHPPGCRGRR
jgi:hypothetical protein